MSDPTEIPAAGPALAQRYGGGRRRRTPLVLGTLLALALLAWAIWAMWANGHRAIEADVTSYQVVDSHQIKVKLRTHFRDDGVDGTCLVRATAADHTIVGELNLTADQIRSASGDWIAVRTERRATTAEVVRCSE